MYKDPVKKFVDLLNIDFPIIQAPMAGAADEHLAAAVSNAGGLGSLGAGYFSALQLLEAIKRIRKSTDRTFNINLFIPPKHFHPDNKKINTMYDILKKYRELFNLPLLEDFFCDPHQIFLDQIEVLIQEKVPVFSFTFGIPDKKIIQRFKGNGTLIIGTATTVAEAVCLQRAGCDFIVAQGIEAGGHRGTFLHDIASSQIGTLALVPQIANAVDIPVIASGGVMDGRGIAAAFCLGASAVQMGTAFLTCQDNGVNEIYKKAILQSTEENTKITRVFSGKPVRGLSNQFMQEMEQYDDQILEYPLQHYLTQAIRKAALAQNNPEYMSIWAGQGTRLSRNLAVNQLMQTLVQETNNVLQDRSNIKI